MQQSLIDEAIEQLAELKVEDVADPATLLYYRAVVEHRTLARGRRIGVDLAVA